MDSNNCLQYRVTGGANGGGGGGAGANNSSGAGDAPYRGVPSSNGDNNANTNTNGPSNSSALSNVRELNTNAYNKTIHKHENYCCILSEHFSVYQLLVKHFN